ncbi:hypothetical protein IJ579_00645 [bacterium]|nr:hypothetical protein [bacterium]
MIIEEQQKTLKKLNDIQHSVYTTQCWLEILKSYIKILDNNLTNKVELVINVIMENNNKTLENIENLWKDLLNIK